MTTAVMSNFLENELIDHILRNASWSSPGTSVYVALYTSNPDEDNSGSEVPSANNYSRVQVTSWDAPASGATANTGAINFPTASGSWGTITHIGILDAATTGNLLFYGELTASKVIGNGDTFSIAAGDLDISLGGAWSTYLANAILSHVLRNTAYTSPGTSIYVALYTDSQTAGDAGTEASGSAYARLQVTGWDAPTDGATANTSDATFTAASGGSWGTIQSCGIRDADTAGNLLFFGDLAASKTVNDGDTFKFVAGELDVVIS